MPLFPNDKNVCWTNTNVKYIEKVTDAFLIIE